MELISELVGLEWLWSLKPWNGVGDFDLEAVRSIAAHFDDPQDSFPSIHVAGTNGKGSVCAFLSSIAADAGRSVGVMTSPHLIRVNERIVVDGEYISDSDLNRLVVSIRYACEQNGSALSFFECITLAGFLYFRERRVDLAIVEVGLGGRLDATNIIQSPMAAVIVSIGLDHQHVLGDDESSIAKEKAGIAKRGTPLFLGSIQNCISEDASAVISKHASEIGAPVFQLGVGYLIDIVMGESNGAVLRLSQGSIEINPKLVGLHQVHNGALAALVALNCGFSVENIERGIRSAYWPARLEYFNLRDRKIIIDCAHNEAGFQVVADFIKDQGIRDVVAVVGFLKTKQWPIMINVIKDLVSEVIVLRPSSEQAEESSVVAEELLALGVFTRIHDGSYGELVVRLLGAEYQYKTMFCLGSIYLVSHIRDALLRAMVTQ